MAHSGVPSLDLSSLVVHASAPLSVGGSGLHGPREPDRGPARNRGSFEPTAPLQRASDRCIGWASGAPHKSGAAPWPRARKWAQPTTRPQGRPVLVGPDRSTISDGIEAL